MWTFTETRFLPDNSLSGVEMLSLPEDQSFLWWASMCPWGPWVKFLSLSMSRCRPCRPCGVVGVVRTVRTRGPDGRKSLLLVLLLRTVANCICNLRLIHRSRQFELLSYSIPTVWKMTTHSLLLGPRLKENEENEWLFRQEMKGQIRIKASEQWHVSWH